jgi:hypothetical protein
MNVELRDHPGSTRHSPRLAAAAIPQREPGRGTNTAPHVCTQGSASRSLWRLTVITVTASLLAMAGAGSADAAGPPATPTPACTPLVCAADYIGVATSNLAAIVMLGNQGGGSTGTNLVLELLDAAKQTKLDANCADGPTPAALDDIVATHDHARDGLAVYAVSGVLPLMAP